MAMVSCNFTMLRADHFGEAALPRAYLETVAEDDIIMHTPKACHDGKKDRLCLRMNSKNNRRVMKRLMGGNRIAQGASAEVFPSDDAFQLAFPPRPPGHFVFSNEIMEPGNVDFIRLRYAEAGSRDRGASTSLTLVASDHASLPAIVDVSEDKQGSLEEHIEFRAEPTLPEGLVLHERTGFISGIPSKAQETPTDHTITISISATGKGGVPLGKIPLTSCRIVICIVEAKFQ